MDIRKIITGLTLSLLLGSGVAVAADFNKGLEAAQSGNFKTALAEWTPLAEQGHALAQYNLGILYQFGNGVPKNAKAALKWYLKAAEQGHAGSQWRSGVYYDVGVGVLENDKIAVRWFTLAAEQEYAFAQLSLAGMYIKGSGVLKDKRRAYMWLSLAGYNGQDIVEIKDEITMMMTPADISKAQDMSSRCLESNYTDC